jgi:peptidoglycan/xylan/chitin deacetylase (PgdA/CDA1 family)
MTQLVIKIDVDTDKGTRIGIPNLLRIFKNLGIKATFLLSLGPDHTGRTIFRIFRKGFLKNASRTNAIQIYGIKTLINGLLIPGPHIGRRHGDIMRRIEDEGHEVGIHCYDHIRWQDHLHRMSFDEVKSEFLNAYDMFKHIFGRPSKGIGSAGWQTNQHSLWCYDHYDFLYSSDTRGLNPFFPRMDNTIFKTLQIPTNLPTLDEVLGRIPSVDDYYDDLIASQDVNVMTVHTELEGMFYLNWFEKFLQRHQEKGAQFLTLEDLAKILLKNPKNIPLMQIVQRDIEGRSGLLSVALRE